MFFKSTGRDFGVKHIKLSTRKSAADDGSIAVKIDIIGCTNDTDYITTQNAYSYSDSITLWIDDEPIIIRAKKYQEALVDES